MKIRLHQKFRYQLLVKRNGIKTSAQIEDFDETIMSFNFNANKRITKVENLMVINNPKIVYKTDISFKKFSFWSDFFENETPK